MTRDDAIARLRQEEARTLASLPPTPDHHATGLRACTVCPLTTVGMAQALGLSPTLDLALVTLWERASLTDPWTPTSHAVHQRMDPALEIWSPVTQGDGLFCGLGDTLPTEDEA